MAFPQTESAAPMGDPSIEPAAPEAPVADQDMVSISFMVPRAGVDQMKTLLASLAQGLEGAGQKADEDIAAQKGEMPAGAPGTMAPDDQNSPESLAAEISKMRR